MRLAGRRRGRALADTELPPRPYLAPVAAGAVAAIGGAMIMLDAGWSGFVAGEQPDVNGVLGVLVLAAVGLAGAGAACGPRRRARPYLWWAAACLVASALAGHHAVLARATARDLVAQHPMSAFMIEPTGDARLAQYGSFQDAFVLDESGRVIASVSISSSEVLETGTRVRAVGRFSALTESAWDRRAYREGCVGAVSVVRVLEEQQVGGHPIEALRDALLDRIDPARSEARALIAGIVCGRVSELSTTAASEAFARTGTSHLVAVSGSHLALVTALAAYLLKAIRARPRSRALVLLALMAAYVVLTGGAASAIRSLLMVAGSLAAQLGHRRPHSTSALCLTCIALVLNEPGIAFDVGFQLSALSVLFIQLFGGYLTTALERMRLPASVAEALALTLCAQWATLPVTVPLFDEVSLVAPLANLVLGPVMTALLVVGLVCAPLALVIPAPDLALAAPDALAHCSIFCAKALAGVPYAAIAVDGGSIAPALTAIAGAAAIAAYLAWRLPSPRCCAAVLVVLFCLAAGHVIRWTRFAPAAVTVLDVGQGDAILVRDGGAAVLVDCGVDDAVVTALARQHVYRLDAVLITHWDLDHWGGLPAVLDVLPVDIVLLAAGAADVMPDEARAEAIPAIVELEAGDRVRVGRFTCTMVWPTARVTASENEDSLVWDVVYQEGGRALRMLLTGDTEADEARSYAGSVGDIDVLKLGHHGSAASIDEEVMRALDPEAVIASAGAGNRYGHPTDEAVACVTSYGSAFLSTIEHGDIVVAPGRDGVVLSASGAAT